MNEPGQQTTAPAPAALRPHAWPSGLRWFLAEFVVVVAGILVALALSSWAQGRSEVAREQSYLRQLQADLAANERDLSDATAFFDQRAAAAARVLHRFWRVAPVLDDAFIDDLSLPRTTRRFRPVLGTAEALVSSGDLNLIRSDDMRAAILDYVESTRTHLEDIHRYDETYYRPAVAMLYRGADLFQHARFKTADDRLLPRPTQIERIPFPGSLDDMMGDRSLYDGYNFLLVAHRNQSQHYGDMLAQTQALKSRVDATLQR